MRYLLDAVALLLLGLMGALCWQGLVWWSPLPPLLASVLCFCLGRIDQISHFSASAPNLAQFEIRLRETKDDLEHVKVMSVLLAESMFDIDRYKGTLGAMPASVVDAHHRGILSLLDQVGMTPEAMSGIQERIRDATLFGYCYGLITYAGPLIKEMQQKNAWYTDVGKLGRTPPPKALSGLLKTFSIDDRLALKILEHYRYYAENGRHLDADFWASRDSWPEDR